MWWWQSVALAGAFNLGAAAPADHLTAWAAAERAWAATSAAAETTFSTSRRLQNRVFIASSSRRPPRDLCREPITARAGPSPRPPPPRDGDIAPGRPGR